MIREVIFYMKQDICAAFVYLPKGMALGLCAAALFFALGRLAGKKPEAKKTAALFFLVTYLAVLLQLAFFSREPGSRTGIDLGLFETWGDGAVSRAYFLENIAVFIPFGLLLPAVFQKAGKWYAATLAGLLLSIGIETAQLVTSRGFCQLDDVITNTLGAFLGWGIYTLLKSMVRRF